MSRRLALMLLLITTSGAGAAHAGPYADTMGRCLVSATSEQDRTDLVRWIFASFTLHPKVSDLSSLDAAGRDKITRTAIDLMLRLVTVACRKETREAIQYEGPMALQSAFQVLGQVAARSLMSDPVVISALSDVDALIDPKKIEEALKAP